MTDEPQHDVEWNAGDMGCGELVLELRNRMLAMHAGDVLLLVARDPGAREDLPAWCLMTRHTLVHADHPDYWIRRRDDGAASLPQP